MNLIFNRKNTEPDNFSATKKNYYRSIFYPKKCLEIENTFFFYIPRNNTYMKVINKIFIYKHRNLTILPVMNTPERKVHSHYCPGCYWLSYFLVWL